MDENTLTIAVTGASGLLGQRLLGLLDARDDVDHIVGLDVRDPARFVAKLTFHRVDIPGSDVKPLLEGVDVIVHLASLRDPLPDVDLMRRVNLEGTRRVCSAASDLGIDKIVWASSAAVYGAWPDNPVPLTEEALVRPSPGYLPALHDAECERMLAEWEAAGERRAVVLRLAPVVGPGPVAVLARAALGHPPVTVRESVRPIQVVHVDDAADALGLAATAALDGVYNVAADGWLAPHEAESLLGHRHVPGLPAEVAQRTLGAMWATGLGDAPPSILPYLHHPWVVANDRIRGAGWSPRHTNEEAILLSRDPGSGSSQVGWIAAAGAILAGAAAATIAMRRRRRRG